MPHGDAVSRAWPPSSSSVSASDVTSLSPLSPLHLSLPAYPSPPLPTSLGFLRPLAHPHEILPPAPAANIARRDEDVGNWTGRVVTHRSLAGGSAPRGKCLRIPRTLVRDGISRPLFRHLPQQWHPVHCLPVLWHLHISTDGPVLEQFECQVQLQHHSTVSRAHRLGQLTVELVLNPP